MKHRQAYTPFILTTNIECRNIVSLCLEQTFKSAVVLPSSSAHCGSSRLYVAHFNIFSCKREQPRTLCCYNM